MTLNVQKMDVFNVKMTPYMENGVINLVLKIVLLLKDKDNVIKKAVLAKNVKTISMDLNVMRLVQIIAYH